MAVDKALALTVFPPGVPQLAQTSLKQLSTPHRYRGPFGWYLIPWHLCFQYGDTPAAAASLFKLHELAVQNRFLKTYVSCNVKITSGVNQNVSVDQSQFLFAYIDRLVEKYETVKEEQSAASTNPPMFKVFLKFHSEHAGNT